MRIKEVKVYTFDELPKKQQEKILDKRREREMWDDWHESTIENFEEEIKAKGIEVEYCVDKSRRGRHRNLYFDLYGQGSHASFGTDHIDNKKFIEAYGWKKDFPLVYLYPSMVNVWMDLSGHHNYMSINSEDLRYDEDEDPQFELREVLAGRKWEDEIQEYERAVEEKCKEEAGRLHKLLQEEYDYYNSDEYLTQQIIDDGEEFEMEE